ncbi:MAG: hypothetical protein LBT53_05860 [Puniceicoccales bacterium]|jgi:integrase|nr:hypothetical protein [Puniceicoccales bacterium]
MNRDLFVRGLCSESFADGSFGFCKCLFVFVVAKRDTFCDTFSMSIPKTQKGTVPVVWIPKRERYMLTTYTDGQKRRRFFLKEAEALREWKLHVRAVAAYGSHAAAYDVHAHREFEEAKRLADGADLRDIVREWRAAGHGAVKVVSVADAANEYLLGLGKRGLAVSHVGTVRGHIRAFVETFGKVLCVSVPGAAVLDWLLGLGVAPKTVRNYRKSLSAFFAWAGRRGYVSTSPMIGVIEQDLPVVPAPSKGTLSVMQCRDLLAWGERERPEWCVWFALQFFAGLRHSEAGRFRWEWVDFERRVLTLPGWHEDERMVKTGDNWALHGLPENLWAWLEKYKGQFAVPSESELKRVRAKVWPAVIGCAWPQNGPRHTFCMMLCSLHGDAGKVATWSRHTSPAQLYQSYVTHLVSRVAAEEYCGIVPA